jgi:hypothetical protein
VQNFFEDMSFGKCFRHYFLVASKSYASHFTATANPGGPGTGGSNSQDNMNNIAEMIRTDPSMRQMFINIATQRDPALGRQLTQNLRLLDVVTRTAGPQGVHGQLSVTEKEAIQRASACNRDLVYKIVIHASI